MGLDNINILTLSDTHIIENIDLDDKNQSYKIQDYSFINRGWSKGGDRGVRIFIKRGVDCERRKDLDLKNIEMMWIEIFIKKSKNILIATLKIFLSPTGHFKLSST